MNARITEQSENPLNGVIILGSARSDGNTRRIAEELAQMTGLAIADLNAWRIEPFDYNAEDRDDDFIPLIEALLNYDLWVMATPVYWYSMSSVMKVFFDRFTDLLKWKKPIGRRIRGRSMALVSCSGNRSMQSFFQEPFALTASYLGMEFIGWLHTWIENGQIPQDVRDSALEFKELLDMRAVSKVTS